MRTDTLRQVAAATTFGVMMFSGGVIYGQSRHPGLLPPPPPPPTKPAATDDGSSCTGVTCPVHGVAQLPAYDAIEFVEEQGGQFALDYDRLCALALSAPRNTLVLQYTLYDAIVEGRDLEALYQGIRKRHIGWLQAASLANGETRTIPVVPLSLPRSSEAAYENRAWGNALPPLLTADDPADAQEPEVTRVRVVLPSPYSFGKKGEYIREEE